MNLGLTIARKYLFGKKDTSIINLITGLSMLGIAIGTAALFLVLSVFNGFESLLTSMVNQFNPDIKIEAFEGKFIESDSVLLDRIKSIDGVIAISECLEEVALFEYDGSMDIGKVKGVDQYYTRVNSLDSAIVDGSYIVESEGKTRSVMGIGLAAKLSIGLNDPFTPIAVHMPKIKIRGILDKPFKTQYLYPGGIFSIQPEFDNEYLITTLSFVENLMQIKNKRSSIEINIDDNKDIDIVVDEMSKVLGKKFVIKDRKKQDEAYYKLMNIEKWMFFALFALMMILIAFNVVGALWMIVLDKKLDIAILKSMGGTESMIRNIFLFEGLLIAFWGLVSGLVLGGFIFFLQKNIGLISIPEGFMIDSYPMSFKWTDLVVVSSTVLTIGVLAAIAPAIRAMSLDTHLRGS